MSKKHKIKESKQIIYSLAQTATDKIYENKFLIQEIDSLKNSIKLIKEFLIQYSSLEIHVSFHMQRRILVRIYYHRVF